MAITQKIEQKETTLTPIKIYYPPLPIAQYQVCVDEVTLAMAKDFEGPGEHQVVRIRLRVLSTGSFYGQTLRLQDVTPTISLPNPKRANSRKSNLLMFLEAVENKKFTEGDVANFRHNLEDNLNALEGRVQKGDDGKEYRTGGKQLRITTDIYVIPTGEFSGKEANTFIKVDTCKPISSKLPDYFYTPRVYEIDPAFLGDDPTVKCDFLDCDTVIHGWIAGKGTPKEMVISQQVWVVAQEDKYDGNSYCSAHYSIMKAEKGSATLPPL